MKKSIILFFLVLFVSEINAFNFSVKTVSPTNYSFVVNPTVEIPSKVALQALLKMKTADIEKMLGRKLKFKEKIALKILKFKNRKSNFDYESSKEGIEAKKLGILALIFTIVFLPAGIVLAILAISKANKALKKNPNDKEAKSGKLFGIISLAYILIAAIAIIIFLSTFTLNLMRG